MCIRDRSILLFNHFLNVCGAHELSLFAKSNDLFWLDGLVSSAALRVQELKQLLKCVRVGGVSEERAFALNANQVLGFEFFQVVGQGGIGNL